MNVRELYHFSKWLEEHGTDANVKYNTLFSLLNHNATQPDKQPIKEPFEELKKTLDTTPLEQLTSQEVALLRHFEIGHLLGAKGAKFVQETVEVSDFDPATAATKIQEAQQSLNSALSLMKTWENAFEDLAFHDELDEPEENRVIVRIQFKDKASISNLIDWKSWSNEWLDIVRGVARCVKEAPEETQVIGATNGSIIMVLSGTISFTTVLAVITKQLSFVIKEGLEITNAIEDLRHKKFMNKTIETELIKKQKKISDDGIKSTVKAVISALPEKIDGEQENALKIAVEKFFQFNELGGDVDFVAPPEENIDEETDEAPTPNEINDLRQTIEEIRSTKVAVKLLTNNLDDVSD